MTRILVTGVSGLLGLNFSILMGKNHSIIGVYHENRLVDTPFELAYADLTDINSVQALLDRAKPEVIFNCAAMANIEMCHETPQAAKKINADLPAYLAHAARQKGIKLVHISTDAVFDGVSGDYLETDSPNPLSVYAASKLEGEANVFRENPDAIIARVNFYGNSISGKRSLAEWFYNNLSNGISMMGFTDVFFCPLFVDELSVILWRMVEKELKGLYHVVSSECLSKHKFGIMIAREFGFDEALIRPASWQEAGLRASRSPKLTLNVEKIQNDLGLQMPGQRQGIKSFYAKVANNFPHQIKQYLDR